VTKELVNPTIAQIATKKAKGRLMEISRCVVLLEEDFPNNIMLRKRGLLKEIFKKVGTYKRRFVKAHSM